MILQISASQVDKITFVSHHAFLLLGQQEFSSDLMVTHFIFILLLVAPNLVPPLVLPVPLFPHFSHSYLYPVSSFLPYLPPYWYLHFYLRTAINIILLFYVPRFCKQD
jgi:hypothetical protein